MRVKELAENLKISTDELIKNLSNVIFTIKITEEYENGKIVELYTFPFEDACGIRYRFNEEGIYPLGWYPIRLTSLLIFSYIYVSENIDSDALLFKT